MTSNNSPPTSPLEQVVSRFWEVLPAISNSLRARIRTQAVEEFDMPPAQFHLLRRIRAGKTSVGELAQDRRTSPPAVSRAVEALVQKGLVSRTPNPQDRRQVTLSLTPTGDQLLDRLFSLANQWLSKKLATLDQDEIQVVHQALEALEKVFC